MHLFLDLLDRRKTPELVKRHFVRMYQALLSGQTGLIPWSEIEPLAPQDTVPLNSLKHDGNHLHDVAVLKLNGGLGTTMGCTGPKSLVEIKDGKNFLDYLIRQMGKTRSQLLLMNSPYTHAETEAYLKGKIDHISFLQHEFPRIDAHTLGPCPDDWYPPGHGDLYWVLMTTDLLKKIKAKYLFISNVDNLGATLEPRILNYMIDNNLDFVMEITAKTKLDVKGGTLIRHRDRLTLLERAQVEPAHISDFEDITYFPYFNTNTIWLNIESLKKQNNFELPVIVNRKNVKGKDIIQLETAMGAAIGVFSRSAAVIVDRDRFFPVKKMSDLEMLQSDRVTEDSDGYFHWKNLTNGA